MGVKNSVMKRLMGNADKFSDEQVLQTLQLLVEHGIKRNASGIHIEPHERYILVRYRIGNVLRGMHKLPTAALPKLMQQVKLLADLDPLETHAPQDGQYDTTVDGQTVTVDASVMPVLGGEKAVLHLRPHLNKPPELESLGFWGASLEQIRQSLARPHGLVLAAGPKRAGISTTLHSLLDQLNTPLVSIATVEARPKHRIPGATHVHMDARQGDTVLAKLHQVLRQDPNIIMVDRLPDKETAALAVHTALQGHMVLAGLHADGAIAGLRHIRAMGVEPFLLASTLRLSIGQRLVRRLCTNCRERHEVSAEEKEHLETTLDITTPTKHRRIQELEQAALDAGIGDSELCSNARGISHVWHAHEAGCEHCEHTGYHGYIAIVEVLQNTDAIQKKLLNPTISTARELHQTALKDGFIPLALDGVIKSLRGETTIEEVLRVAAP